jgi:molecular chaperone DnaK (HSP70)
MVAFSEDMTVSLPSFSLEHVSQPFLAESVAPQRTLSISTSTTVLDAKRLIGCKYSDPEVRRDVKHWPFKLTNKAGKPMINVKHKGGLKEFTPQEVLSLLLSVR